MTNDPVGRFRSWLQENGYSTLERDDVEGLGTHIIVLRPQDTLIVGTVYGHEAIAALCALEEQLRWDTSLNDFERFERLHQSLATAPPAGIRSRT